MHKNTKFSDFHGSPRFSSVLHGSPRFSTVLHGSPRFSIFAKKCKNAQKHKFHKFMVTCAFFVKNHVKLNKKHIFVKKCKKTQKMWFFMISCIFNPFCRFAVFYSWILCLACKSYYLLQLYISCANQWNPVKCIENVCAKRMLQEWITPSVRRHVISGL